MDFRLYLLAIASIQCVVVRFVIKLKQSIFYLVWCLIQYFTSPQILIPKPKKTQR